jgi:DNA-binding HxlR family transcriptional regulator
MTKANMGNYYCGAARALEVVGEKWSLLIVRDLLRGPLRFSDILRSLDGITPKLLTQRLRDLEAACVIERDEEPGRRDVWYRLSSSGQALRPVIQELLIWGVEYGRKPEPEETINPLRVATGTIAVLNRQRRFPIGPTVWALDTGGRAPQVIRFDGQRWAMPLAEDRADPDLVIRSAADIWISLLRLHDQANCPDLSQIELEGDLDRIAEFSRLLGHQSDRETELPLAVSA